MTEKILTTHVGSLIRPPELLPFIRAKQNKEPYDAGAYAKCLRDSVAAVVKRQVEAGIDIPSDGEFGKGISWSQYVLERMSGFARRPKAMSYYLRMPSLPMMSVYDLGFTRLRKSSSLRRLLTMASRPRRLA